MPNPNGVRERGGSKESGWEEGRGPRKILTLTHRERRMLPSNAYQADKMSHPGFPSIQFGTP